MRLRVRVDGDGPLGVVERAPIPREQVAAVADRGLTRLAQQLVLVVGAHEDGADRGERCRGASFGHLGVDVTQRDDEAVHLAVGVEQRLRPKRHPVQLAVVRADAHLAELHLAAGVRLVAPGLHLLLVRRVDEFEDRHAVEVGDGPAEYALHRRRHPGDHTFGCGLEHDVGRVLGEAAVAGLGLGEVATRERTLGHVAPGDAHGVAGAGGAHVVAA